MEEKRRFFKPITWAKHCVNWTLILLSMIVFAIIASLVLSFLDYNPLTDDTFVNTLKGLITSVFGFLLIVFYIIHYALILAVLLGSVVTLIGLLINREKSKKPYLQVSFSIFMSLMLFGLSAFAHRKYVDKEIEFSCRNHLNYLGDCVLQVSGTNKSTFEIEIWCDLIKEQVGFDNMFECSRDNEGPCSYAINKNILTNIEELPDNMVVLFESELGWNGIGGPDDVVIDRHDKSGANILFFDGRVEFVEAEDIPNLRWKVADKRVCYVPILEEDDVPIVSYYVDFHIEKLENLDLKISVIMAIWKDGTIVWSKNELGGPPYYKSKLPLDEVSSFLKTIRDNHFFEDSTCNKQYRGIHDHVPTFIVLMDEKCILMENSHFIHEKYSQDTIGTSVGAYALLDEKDRERAEELRTEDYLRFRKNWDDTINLLTSYIPDDGEVLENVIFSSKRITYEGEQKKVSGIFICSRVFIWLQQWQSSDDIQKVLLK